MKNYQYYLLTKYYEAGQAGISYSDRVNRIMQSPEYIHELSGDKENELNDFLYTVLKQPSTGLEIISDSGIKLYLLEKAKRDKLIKNEERKEKLENIDLSIKSWTYKARYLPFILSLFALGVSVASYFKPEKKQTDLHPMQEDINLMKEQIRKLDSLIQISTRQKKDS